MFVKLVVQMTELLTINIHSRAVMQ